MAFYQKRADLNSASDTLLKTISNWTALTLAEQDSQEANFNKVASRFQMGSNRQSP